MNSKIMNYKLVLVAIIMAFCLSIGVKAGAVDVLSSDVMAYQGIFMKGDIFISVVLYTDDSEYPRVGGVTQINTPEIDQYGYAVGTQTGSFSGGLYQQSEGYYTKAGESEYGIIFKNGGISIYGINNADTSYAGDYIQVSNSGANMSPGDIWLRIPGTENHEKDIRVILDGREIEFDVPPQIINDRTMVPMRAIFEALGYEVEWSDESAVATATSVNNKLSIYDQCYNISSSAGIYESDVPVQIVNDRLLVPARAVAECGGCEVAWNEVDRTVLITSNAGTRIGKSSDLSMNTVILDKMFDDDMQAYEYFRDNIFPDKLFDVCSGWVTGRLKFIRDIRKPDNEQPYGELEHTYVDIDNDGLDELVIIAGVDMKLLGSSVCRDVYIWKLRNDKIINLLAMSYMESGRSMRGDYYIISYENKNYLAEHRANSKYSGAYQTWEIFKYENNDWVSVFNVISDSDIDKHFINGRSVAENEATDASDEINSLIVYDYSDYPIK